MAAPALLWRATTNMMRTTMRDSNNVIKKVPEVIEEEAFSLGSHNQKGSHTTATLSQLWEFDNEMMVAALAGDRAGPCFCREKGQGVACSCTDTALLVPCRFLGQIWTFGISFGGYIFTYRALFAFDFAKGAHFLFVQDDWAVAAAADMN